MEAVIDMRQLTLLGGAGDPELREIIDDFATELGEQLVQAKALAGASEQSSEEIRILAHKIRGMAGSLGFKPLSALAATRDADDWNESETGWVAQLDTAVTEAIVAWEDLKRSVS
jgi:HPt (histidine-containing phosphotransfer) domain-containing protein